MRGMRLQAFAAAFVVALLVALPASSQNAPAGPAAATPAPAANVYNIEIVIFRTNQAMGAAENWSAQDSRVTGTDGETSTSTRSVGRFVGTLPPTSWQLTPLETKLRSTGLYVPVAHVAW